MVGNSRLSAFAFPGTKFGFLYSNDVIRILLLILCIELKNLFFMKFTTCSAEYGSDIHVTGLFLEK